MLSPADAKRLREILEAHDDDTQDRPAAALPRFVRIVNDPQQPETKRIAGLCGTVIDDDDPAAVAVEFPQKIAIGHDCNGATTRGHGYYFAAEALADADAVLPPTLRTRFRTATRIVAHLVPLAISGYYLATTETAADLYAVAVRAFFNLIGIFT